MLFESESQMQVGLGETNLHTVFLRCRPQHDHIVAAARPAYAKRQNHRRCQICERLFSTAFPVVSSRHFHLRYDCDVMSGAVALLTMTLSMLGYSRTQHGSNLLHSWAYG